MNPCPFCDGTRVRLDSVPIYGDTEGTILERNYFVRCDCCGAEGPWYKTEGNAIRFWNMRPGDKQ